MTLQEWRRAATGLLVPTVIVLVWVAGSVFNWWPQSVISSPLAAARAWWRLLASGELITHTFVSLTRLLVGCGLGLLLGILTASLTGLSPLFSRAFRPTLDFLTPIPVLAWVPIFIVVFGIDGAKVSLIALGTGLIMYGTTLTVIADTKAEYIDVARLYNKRSVQVLTQISLPSGAWSLLGGLRMAFGLSWVLLLASELIASSEGLGWLIWDSRNFSRADEMMAAMLWVGCLGFTCDYTLARIQSWVTRWRPTFHGLEK